jgi:hypothetical protein
VPTANDGRIVVAEILPLVTDYFMTPPLKAEALALQEPFCLFRHVVLPLPSVESPIPIDKEN